MGAFFAPLPNSPFEGEGFCTAPNMTNRFVDQLFNAVFYPRGAVKFVERVHYGSVRNRVKGFRKIHEGQYSWGMLVWGVLY